MNPLWPALSLAGCLALAVSGLAMVRTPPRPAERFVDDLDELALRARRRSVVGRMVDALGARFGPRLLPLLGEERRGLISHRLDAAGHPGGMTLKGYASRKAGSLALGLMVGALLLLLGFGLLILLAAALVGWFQTDFALIAAARRRQDQIDRELPDFLDILSVIVQAGVGFRTALQRVASALGGPFGEEVTTALRQMDVGQSRRSAFLALRDRNDSDSLGQFVSALLQAEELGAPLATTLGTIAKDMRQEFRQTALRKAARATPRVSLIVTTVVVPGAIVLILAALFVSSGFQGGGLVGGAGVGG